MKTIPQKLNITVLEDSDFYNRILTTRLENFTNELALYHGFRFQLETYAHTDDFIRNLKSDTDIAFIDFYLGQGLNALDILYKIKRRCHRCKIVILSQSRRAGTMLKDAAQEMTEFIFKDQYAIPRTCFIVEEIAQERFGKSRHN